MLASISFIMALFCLFGKGYSVPFILGIGVCDHPRYRTTCTLPFFRVDEVDGVVWQWIKTILLDPEQLARAFSEHQQDAMGAHAPVL